jgi:RND superfamily putative drug exporter
MELLGNANWWLPRWLDKILPKINVEGETLDVDELEPPAREPVPTGV